MKPIWKHRIICVLLIAVLLTQFSAVAFAADPYPEVFHLAGGVPNADGSWVSEYWVDSDGNRADTSADTGSVRAAAALPSRYDLRDYGLVTHVKNQAGAGNCWAFGSVASLESNYILQGYGTLSETDFSEAHLAWFSQRQRTTDKSDLTYGDGLHCAYPFSTGGNWNRIAATLMRGVGLQLERNAPWIVTYDTNTLMQMAQEESDRYVSYARMWSATKVCDNSAAVFKQKIIENGAAILSYYDDADTTRTGYSADKQSYYQTAVVGRSNHVVSVIGWDDNYPRTKFNAGQRPSANGAWLVKGSWGTSWAAGGYYWISYEDPSLGEFASYVSAPTDIYDHIYQYDGAYPSVYFSIPNSGKMANVFTAERTEMLTHVAFFSPNELPVNVTAEIYILPEDMIYSGMHPTLNFERIDAATTSVADVEYGYTTIELASPTLLKEGDVFSVVLTMERNGYEVRIPAEGETVSNPGDGVTTYSGSIGDSFMGYSGYWYDVNAYPNGTDYNNVPLKAMTCDITPTEPTLSVGTQPSQTTYRVGDSFDPSGFSLLYTNEYGITELVTDGFTVTPEAFSEIGTQTVVVTYKDVSVTFDVTIEPYETTLSPQIQPSKATYLVGEAFDPTGLVLTYTDEYGVEHTVTDGFTYEPSVLSEIGTQTVTVTYNGVSTTFEVTVEPYDRTLTVTTMPNQTTYRVGDTIDTDGLVLLYTDEYGTEHTVQEGLICTPQKLRTIGAQTVTVTYSNLSTSFDVTVQPYETTLTLYNPPARTNYRIGESFDPAGLALQYTDEYGDVLIVSEGFVCTPETLDTVGTQTVTAVYEGLSITFDVTVELYEPTLELRQTPESDKMTYRVGETLDPTGFVLTFMDEYGTVNTVTEGFTCEPSVLSEIGTQTVTVTYNNLCVTFDVTVEPYETSLTLQTMPDKTTYLVGESVDLTGLSLEYSDEYGERHTVSEGLVCVPQTLRMIGTQTVNVTYAGLSVTFELTAEPYETTLTLCTMPYKTLFRIGETFDPAGLTLQYTDEYGDALIVGPDDYTCTPTILSEVGTQTITAAFGGLSVTFDVTVELLDAKLSLSQMPNKTTYLVGETLDPTGLALIFTDEYGRAHVVTDGYTYNPHLLATIGQQTVTVTYGDLTVTFDVTVEAFETSLTLLSPPMKRTYLVGDSINTAGLLLLYSDEYGVPHTVSEGFVCIPQMLRTIGGQTVTVTYRGLSVTFDVTVEPQETTLTLTKMPDKTTYTVREAFDPMGIELLYTDEYGDALNVTEGFVCTPQTLMTVGTQTVSVTYRDRSVTLDVTVEPQEPTLALGQTPDKTTYLVGEAFDPTGLALIYTSEFGIEQTVTDNYICDPQTLPEIGTQTVTVTYRSLSVTFDVTVEPHETTLTLRTTPNKTVYKVGDTIETEGLSLLYSDEYAAQHVVLEGFVCVPQTLRAIGEQTVTVTYKGLSVTFEVTAEPYEPTLSLLNAPIITNYRVGDALDPTGLMLYYTDEYGTEHTVTEGYTCSVEIFDALGIQPVIVTYEGLCVKFDVTVEKFKPILTLQTPPDKTTYLYAETLDTAGLTLLYRNEYGEMITVNEGFVCDAQTLFKMGTVTVTATYADLSVTFDVTVEPHEPTLSIRTLPDKTVYSVKQTIDLSGLSLVYTDEYGDAPVVTEGFACDVEMLTAIGTQVVTVTYLGLSVTFEVTVEPVDATLTLQFAPIKTNYLAGERLDTTGLTLFYTDALGDATVVTEGFACSPRVLRKIGTQTVTVTYNDLTVTFEVTVKYHEPTLELISAPDKRTYMVGDALETAGLSLSYTDEYGEVSTVTDGFMCDPMMLTTIGQKTVVVTYRDLSVTFDVTVEPYETALTLQTPPNKTTYYVGQTLDTDGLTLLYSDERGIKQTVTEGFVCDLTTLPQIGVQTVTVTYAGLSVTFDVTALAYDPTLTLRSMPNRTSYYAGGKLETAGLSLLYTNEYGDALVVTDGFACSPQTLNSIGTQTVTVTYAGLSVTFIVTVQAVVAVSATVVSAPQNSTYIYKKSPDFSGLTVRVHYNDGHDEIVNKLSQMNIQAESSARVRRGAQTFRVTTKGVSATFTMQVRLAVWQWLILIFLFGFIWY